MVVVMTDGRDENNPGNGPGSTQSLADVRSQLKDSGATVFAIGLGTKVDAAPLKKLADLSGGRALLPQDVSELGAEFQRVVEDLRRRYVVGYTSTNGARTAVAQRPDSAEVGASGHRSKCRGYNAPER